MTVVTNTRVATFSQAAKRGLEVGKELNEGGLIWRKLSDGTGSWRYDFMQAGVRCKGVIGRERDGVTLSQARNYLGKLRAQATLESMARRAGESYQGKKRFSEVAQEYLVWGESHLRCHRHNISRMRNHLLPYLGEDCLEDITTATVEELRSILLRKGLSRQTVQRVISLLSSVYEHARKSDHMLVNPTRGLSRMKAQDAEIEVFTSVETELLLQEGAKSTRDRVMVGLALFAGLRASEALGLCWENVDLELGVITVTQTAIEGSLQPMTKSYKSRVVPISKTLRKILLAHRAATRVKGLVLSEDGEKPYHQVQRIFQRIKQRAGVDTAATYHGLRHTFATRAVQKGIDLPTLQQWMGHSDIKVTMRYIHTNSAHMRKMAALLDR